MMKIRQSALAKKLNAANGIIFYGVNNINNGIFACDAPFNCCISNRQLSTSFINGRESPAARFS